MNQLDLFPADLLVSCAHGRIYTTSRIVAEHFDKRHKNVLRVIEKLLGDLQEIEFSRLNFEPSDYQNDRGKTYTEYRLTHDGFALLAMSFTGAKALEWKVKFLSAFRQMERQLFLRTEKYAAALDRVRPCLRPVVEATEAGCRRAEIALPLGKSVNAITYHRRVARKVGLLPDQESGREPNVGSNQHLERVGLLPDQESGREAA